MGLAFLWEQRCFLAYLGIDNGTDFRKDEAKRRRLEEIADEWGLDVEHSVVLPGQSGFNTKVFASGMVFAWLANLSSPHPSRTSERLRRTYDVLESYIGIAERGFQSQPVLSTVGFAGAVLTIGMATGTLSIDLAPLINGQWPNLREEWSLLRSMPGRERLCPFAADSTVVSLGGFILFVAAREAAGREPCAVLGELRQALLTVLAAFFEIGTALSWERSETQQRLLQAPRITSGRTARRLRMGVASKCALLKKIADHSGSDETFLADQHLGKGIAAVMKSAHITVYMDQARRDFRFTRACCIQWDEATHGGLNINAGLIVDADSGHGAYMQPAVACSVIWGNVSGDGGRGERGGVRLRVGRPFPRKSALETMGGGRWGTRH